MEEVLALNKSIMVVDAHPVTRLGLSSIISSVDGWQVVAEASSVKGALRQIARCNIDLLLVDLAFPDGSGFDVLKEAREAGASFKSVVITGYHGDEYVTYAMDLGAKGYLLKEDSSSEIISCIDRVLQGHTSISGSLGIVSPPVVPNSVTHKLEKLTVAQLKILRALSSNQTSKEIAREIGVSYRTVQAHRYQIAKTLGLPGHNKLIDFSIRNRDHISIRISEILAYS